MGSSRDRPRPAQSVGASLLSALAIVVPYTLGLGLFVATAVASYARRDLRLPAVVDHHLLIVAWVTLAVALAVAAVLLVPLRVGPRELGLGVPARPRLTWWEAVPLAYLALWGGKQAFELCGDSIRPSAGLGSEWGGWEVVSYCLHTAVAEELLMVAIPVAVLTRLRVPLGYQILVVFALRSLIHLYYGWPAFVLAAVWTLLLMSVYVRYRSVWPLVATHAVYDLAVFGGALGAAGAVFSLVGLVLLVAGLGVVVRRLAGRRRRGRPVLVG